MDNRIVWTHVKIDTLCEHWLPHPWKKSRHMLHLLSTRTIAVGIRSHVPLGRLSHHDGHKRVRHRPGERHFLECFCPRYHGLHGVGAISYNSQSHLVFPQGNVNSAQVVNPVLLTFIRQEGDVLVQQDNTRPHMAAAMQHILCGVQQLPWPARTPRCRQLNI